MKNGPFYGSNFDPKGFSFVKKTFRPRLALSSYVALCKKMRKTGAREMFLYV